MRMKLRPGQRLRSVVCDAEVIVVRAPTTEVDVRCGGALMVEQGTLSNGAFELDPTLNDGPLLGKRYADDELGLEVLCTRGGKGTLMVDGRALKTKLAKPLPASD